MYSCTAVHVDRGLNGWIQNYTVLLCHTKDILANFEAPAVPSKRFVARV